MDKVLESPNTSKVVLFGMIAGYTLIRSTRDQIDSDGFRNHPRN